MYLRCYTEKIGQFELLETKNLCYTSSNFTYWNYFPQEPVILLLPSLLHQLEPPQMIVLANLLQLGFATIGIELLSRHRIRMLRHTLRYRS